MISDFLKIRRHCIRTTWRLTPIRRTQGLWEAGFSWAAGQLLMGVERHVVLEQLDGLPPVAFDQGVLAAVGAFAKLRPSR